MKKQCIEDPKELDWTKFWIEKLKNKKDRGKDWNKSAETFHKKAKRDDYHDLLFSKLIISKEDSVLDLGCGEGSITILLSKIAKNVTGIDSAEKMLELLNKRAKEQNITNINTIEESIEEISLEKLGNYDVVLASRSLNNIIPIKKVLCEINKIANKYVFISLFGPENWKVEKDFQEYLGKTPYEFPGHDYVFNTYIIWEYIQILKD